MGSARNALQNSIPTMFSNIARKMEQSYYDIRHIRVACAIIEEDGLVLAAQRSETMSMPLKWEFPGGKIEDGESATECLQRELLEELGIVVSICKQLPTASHLYDDFAISLYPFICSLERGDITLHEHRAITWVPPECMLHLEWAAADLPVIDSYLQSRWQSLSSTNDSDSRS